MKLLVCIKPDHTGQDIGPFEHLALEAALTLREAAQASGRAKVVVDVITAGPESWRDCLLRALGTGADRGIHILTCPDSGQDHPGLVPADLTARMLAGAVPRDTYDLILTGVMSQELMAGQTGPMLARMLSLPCATAVVSLEFEGADRLLAVREMDGGLQETLAISLPALVSIQSGGYAPRYPVLSHMLRAGQKPLTTLEPEDIPSPAVTFCPPKPQDKTRQGLATGGDLERQIGVFNTFLKERGLL